MEADAETIEFKRCPLTLLCDLYPTSEAYGSCKSAFLNHDIWAQNLVEALELSILAHILFSTKNELYGFGSLEFRAQTDQL